MSNIILSKKFIAKINEIIQTFWWTGVSSEPTTKLCVSLPGKTSARQKKMEG
jgi:hypothetical protein